MSVSHLPAPTVAARRALRRATLLALYHAAEGSPVPRIELAGIAASVKASVDDVLCQLLVLESLGLTNDVDRSGAALQGRGVLLAERLLAGDDVTHDALQ